MNIQRILFGAAWLATLIVAYLLGGQHSAPTFSGAAIGPDQLAETRPVKPSSTESAAPLIAKEGKPSVASLIARARLEMGNGMGGMMNLRSMLRAIGPIAEMDDAQIQEALAEVERTVREPQQRMMLYSLLLGQWAETDGKAAMTYAEEKLGSKSPYELGINASILGTWAKRDPEAAWRWFQTEHADDGDERLRIMSLAAIFSGMAANNLDAAFARLSTLDETSRASALSGIAGSATDDSSRRHLLDRAMGLPADQRATVWQTIASRWAMSDPDAAVQWIHSLPPDEQKPLRNSVSNMVMMVNPALGASLLLEGAEAKEKPQLYDRVAGQWAQQDPRAAGEWLLAQPQGAELDKARRTFAAVVSRRDPVVAMDWARSVQDPVQRDASVGQIYQIWKAKDAPAAEKALLGSGLSSEKIKEFQAAPLPKTTRAPGAL
ncbi:MAG: hypothetical protein JWL59_1724 [Chthoniobacteraceae bacterium]|nr:hypothetical protein [Chthoniobacteraceae bacterium]